MIFDKVRELTAKTLDIEEAAITMDSTIIKDLGADSLDIVEMLMEVESEWGITIEDEDVQGFATIGDVVRYIEARL